MVQMKSLFAAAAYGLTFLGAVFAAPSSGHTSYAPPSLPDAQSLAHATRPVYLYHAYYIPQQVEDAVRRVGHSPAPFPVKAGDFSPHGGYYMFMSKEEALYWGNQFSLTPGNNGYFAVATVEYHPSSQCRVVTFPTADQNWANFVNGNNAGTLAVSHYPVIEGALSLGRGSRVAQYVSMISGQPVWQYAVIDQRCLSLLRIAQVERFQADRNWQRQPRVIPRQFRNAGSWSRYCPSCTIQ